MELAETVLKDIISPNENENHTGIYHQHRCRHFHIKPDDIGNKRSSKIVIPRQIAMYLCREIIPHR